MCYWYRASYAKHTWRRVPLPYESHPQPTGGDHHHSRGFQGVLGPEAVINRWIEFTGNFWFPLHGVQEKEQDHWISELRATKAGHGLPSVRLQTGNTEYTI